MSRIVVLVGVLLVMLLVPLYLSKERANKAKAKSLDAAERAIDAQALQRSAAAAPTRHDPERFGLTFGWVPQASADRLHASCRGTPFELANGLYDGCNSIAGDTSCRTVLPVLCLREADGAAPMALATSPPVAGFLITSRADSDARCVQALGPRWRMASYQDTDAGELRGARALDTAADTRARAWVAVKDQRAHCWDPS